MTYSSLTPHDVKIRTWERHEIASNDVQRRRGWSFQQCPNCSKMRCPPPHPQYIAQKALKAEPVPGIGCSPQVEALPGY